MKATLTHKLSERTAELASKQAQLAGVVADNARLTARIGAQTISKADVERLLGERGKQREILASVGQQRSAADKRAVELELQARAAGRAAAGAVWAGWGGAVGGRGGGRSRVRARVWGSDTLRSAPPPPT